MQQRSLDIRSSIRSGHSAGFTLMEIMIVVVIIGILTSIALPSYTGYVTRARLAEAHGALAATQPRLEQHWSNTRSYANFTNLPPDTTNFTYSFAAAPNAPSASAYTLVATGRAAADGFIFTINQAGTRVTTQVPTTPTGWTTSTNCWVDRKGGLCSQ